MALYSCVVLCVWGQTIEYKTNAPRCGDKYVVKQLEYFSPGNEGKGILWDFSNLRSVNQKSEREFFLSKDSVLLGTDEEFLMTYDLSEDSLMCLGYDNRLKHMSFSEPMVLMTYPFSYGYSMSNHYSGLGDYCKKLILKNGGTLIVEADAEGSIVLEEGDTLKNVLRVHTTKLNSISMHAQSDTLLADTSRMKQEIEEHYAWYVRGYRYPMFETSSICYYDNMIPVSCIQKAYYYNPEDITEISDSINEQIVLENSIAKAADIDIIHYEIHNDGYTLTMDYSLDADAKITALISNSRGILYGRKSANLPKGDNYQLSFDLLSLPKGEYVLYINVNGKVYNEKFNMK